MKNIKKYLKKNLSAKEILDIELSIRQHIDQLQKASLIDLNISLKDFVIARR